LFTNFQDSPAVLFYRLPQIAWAALQNNVSTFALSAQDSYQLGNGWWSFLNSAVSSPDAIDLNSVSSVSNNTNLFASDVEVQKFISNTNSAPSNPFVVSNSSLYMGNQCFSGVTNVQQSSWELPIFESPESYLSGIINFVTTPNIDTLVHDYLLQQFKNKSALVSGGITTLANDYAEQMFGDALPGTCEYSCKTLSLDKQVACQLSCSKSCIQTCNDTQKLSQSACIVAYENKKTQCSQFAWVKKSACLAVALAQQVSCTQQTFTDEALCVSDCMCSITAWWREGIEAIL